jgi:hypothetical protein
LGLKRSSKRFAHFAVADKANALDDALIEEGGSVDGHT